MSLLLAKKTDKEKEKQVKSYVEAMMDGTRKLVVVSSGEGHSLALKQSDRVKEGRAIGKSVTIAEKHGQRWSNVLENHSRIYKNKDGSSLLNVGSVESEE